MLAMDSATVSPVRSFAAKPCALPRSFSKSSTRLPALAPLPLFDAGLPTTATIACRFCLFITTRYASHDATVNRMPRDRHAPKRRPWKPGVRPHAWLRSPPHRPYALLPYGMTPCWRYSPQPRLPPANTDHAGRFARQGPPRMRPGQPQIWPGHGAPQHAPLRSSR